MRSLHENSTLSFRTPTHLKVEPLVRGIAFLGMKVFPGHRRIASAKLARSIRHLKKRASKIGLRLNGRGQLEAHASRACLLVRA